MLIKSLYAYRNMETNKIEKLLLLPSGESIDEDRTGYSFEGRYCEDYDEYFTQTLKEVIRTINNANS
jgi:hypothetical protein